MYLFIYSSLHVSSMSCSSSGETNCINTASGNCHSVLVAVSCAGWEFTPNQRTTQELIKLYVQHWVLSCFPAVYVGVNGLELFSWWWAEKPPETCRALIIRNNIMQWFLAIVQLDAQILFNVCSQPAHDTATNTEWQLPEAVLIQFVSPDDEHDMLETCKEL